MNTENTDLEAPNPDREPKPANNPSATAPKPPEQKKPPTEPVTPPTREPARKGGGFLAFLAFVGSVVSFGY